MIENIVSRHTHLEAYGPDTWPDQVMFWNAEGPVGSATHYRGACTPGVAIFNSSEQDGSDFGVSSYLIFFNGAIIDGLTVDFDIAGMWLVDPSRMFAGQISAWPGAGQGSMNVDWGDGSPVEFFALPPVGMDPTPHHVYAEAGSYSLTATAVIDVGAALVESATAVTLDIEVMEP